MVTKNIVHNTLSVEVYFNNLLILMNICICTDVNECEEGTHVCNLEACINEPGGYRCGPTSSDASQCQAGFKLDHSTNTCVGT